MNINDPEEKGNHVQKLRERAEEALRGKPVNLEGLHTDDIQYLLHELQVHQAELAIQNEELRRVQMDLEMSRDLFSNLYNFAPIGFCTISEKGRILNANQTLANMLGMDQEKLLHRLLSEFVDGSSQDEYYLHFRRAIKQSSNQAINHHHEVSEIKLVKSDGRRRLVRIESEIARDTVAQLLVVVSDITEQRRLEALQQEDAVQMILQRRLIEQSERERVEIARNLHDGPIQSLAGLGFSIQIIKEILEENGINQNADIQQLGDDVTSLIAELRSICNNLRPPILKRFGLNMAISENIVEFKAKYPDTKINLEMSNGQLHLPDPITLSLYRIYQHAMHNIYLHANASEVWIRLKLEERRVLLEIQDDGRGLSTPVDWIEIAREGHFGLLGMKERAEAFGGNLEIMSSSGEGTTIQVVIPLAVNDQK